MIDDDEIAERIVKHLRSRHSDLDDAPIWIASEFLDESEAYRLAFVGDVRERAAARRQMRRVRRIVFAKLGAADRAAVEK